MSELGELTAAGRADLLPGHTLSPWRLVTIAEAEEEMERRHIATCVAGAIALPQPAQRLVAEAATRDIRDGAFKYRAPGFDRVLLSPSFTSLRLWLSLRARHPGVTRAQAARLITADNEIAVYYATCEMAGWSFAEKKARAGEAAAAPSAGAPSTTDSASAA